MVPQYMCGTQRESVVLSDSLELQQKDNQRLASTHTPKPSIPSVWKTIKTHWGVHWGVLIHVLPHHTNMQSVLKFYGNMRKF